VYWALLTKRLPNGSSPTYQVGELCIDIRKKRAGLGERRVTLPPLLLKVHIHQIRRRLGLDPEEHPYIRSVLGFGYMLVPPEED
jgi:hypothetical protein